MAYSVLYCVTLTQYTVDHIKTHKSPAATQRLKIIARYHHPNKPRLFLSLWT